MKRVKRDTLSIHDQDAEPYDQAPNSSCSSTTYRIGGVTVEFPGKAYPSQLAMMSKYGSSRTPAYSLESLGLFLRHDVCIEVCFKLIEGLKTKRNCLLESPTGSGKTLALLCSALAWQRYEADRARKNNNEVSSQLQSEIAKLNARIAEVDEMLRGAENETGCETLENEIADLKALVDSRSREIETGLIKVPKIYFGTRTHKQLAQITRELRKTVYKNIRTIILASRDHTCVNSVVKRLENKTDGCQQLLEKSGLGCEWHMNAKKMNSYDELGHRGLRPAYDLEDFIRVASSYRSCPYYISRNLLSSADLIFCPYNYLVDGMIRTNMKVDIENNIVLIDEGHNIEDASREASAVNLSVDDLEDAMRNYDRTLKFDGVFNPSGIEKISKFFSTLVGWMKEHAARFSVSDDINDQGHCWTGVEAKTQWAGIGLHDGYVSEVRDCFKGIIENQDKQTEDFEGEIDIPKITRMTIRTTNQLFRIYFSLNKKNIDDYRVAVLKRKARLRNQCVRQKTVDTLCINLWCLNPAIAFEAFHHTHSVVLTSGTLSPIRSFESELGTVFPIKLEASHVIDPKQVLVGIVGCGPTDVKLNGSFNYVDTREYQDELGELVLRVCDIIPFGVLCFLPSYRLLEKLKARWETTGLMTKLRKVKQIFLEPRTGVAEFEKVIQQFYAGNSTNRCSSVVTGGLFFAVFRGKVSEGLDFADDNARAVICVGIPFPNYRNLEVEMKREYNNKNFNRGLLSGMDWYEIQAFRALNQALGRCIRHKLDWGAILLVDDRFVQSPRYVDSLSKWVRASVENFTEWDFVEQRLLQFRIEMSGN